MRFSNSTALSCARPSPASERVVNDQENLRASRASQNLCRPRSVRPGGECEMSLRRQVTGRRVLVARRVMFRDVLTVDLESDDGDRLSLCEIGKVFPADRGCEVAGAVDERRPFSREVVAQAEE